jgi:uncharacterized protein
MSYSRSRLIRRSFLFFISVLIILNIIAAFHAYKFTHFDSGKNNKTKDAHLLSTGEKIKTLLFGISNPRPANRFIPDYNYKTITLQSNKKIECWIIDAESSKGTIILFHGYSGEKSSMLDKAQVFLNLGYSVMLADFMGSGASEGNQTTLGFYESEEVKTAFDYIAAINGKNIILFGTSMGAVAIMKCINDYHIEPSTVIIECPFGTLLQTVEARFKTMHIPAFPMSNLLVLWGGIENGFNAFSHKPVEYAKQINCPVLVMYGEKDEKVSEDEIQLIYKNINTSRKQLVTFSEAGHENFLKHYHDEWTNSITSFLNLYKY